MTRSHLDAALAAGNPLTDGAAARLPLQDAERELLDLIVATPVRRRPRRIRHLAAPRRLALVLAATAALVAALTVLPSEGSGGGPAPAFAAALVRFANASPLVLLQLPAWHVVYANEDPNGYGEMHFVRGPADANGDPEGVVYARPATMAGKVASLTWTPVTLVPGLAAGHRSAVTGLGLTARSFVYEGGSRHAFDISAQFVYRDRVLEFRATVTSMAMFRAELRALKAVQMRTWLRAMPASVVESAQSARTVRVMLRGVPLPPGFEPARIRGARLVHDRYQLGAAVTGTVACIWIGDWNRARARGDTAMVRRAIAAMATAPNWPILREMAREGAWSSVLIQYARAMPSGYVQYDSGVAGRHPLAPDANNGLGCGMEWGINLW